MAAIGVACVPVLMAIILISGLRNRVKIYDAFMSGAKEGLYTTFKIFPALLGLMVAVGMLRALGTLDLIVQGLKPLTNLLGIPSEVVPLGLMRPISGSGSMAVITDIFTQYGPDSFIGRCASVMMGSTETTFYTIAIYYGSVKITKLRHTVKSAILADLTGMIIAVLVTTLFFH